MSFGVQFTGLKQQPPLTATKATIIAQFAALGVRPDYLSRPTILLSKVKTVLQFAATRV